VNVTEMQTSRAGPTDYYDTDDLRLIRAGITLRRWSGDRQAGWQLRLPLDHGGRRDFRRPLGATAGHVPGDLATLVRVHTRGAPLRPVDRRPAELARAPADLDRRPPLTGSAPAGQVVLAYLRAHAGTLIALDPLVRLDEPDAVHKMRVASRRLRATLRSFGHILCHDATPGLAADLRWLGGVLGAARDAGALADHLRSSLRQAPVELRIGPVEARVQGHFASVRAAARTELLAALDSDRYFSLLDDLDRILAKPPLTPEAARPAADVLPAAARRAGRQAERRMRRAWSAPAGPRRNEALHRARKSARRARYAAEAMTPAIGGTAAGFAKRMKRVQSVLGEQHDAVIAAGAARDLGISAHLAGENAFSYGLLCGWSTCEGDGLQAQARRVWNKAARKKGWPD
jgi:CHAD domain-containing protein